MSYTVLLTTSGVGQRLGDITKHTNPAIVRVGKKAAISYIIEAYPADTEFIITTGYYANLVKDFIGIAHPNTKVTFVDVDTFKGAGSSLGYSMLQAKNHLQKPFIFHAIDTIVTEPVPEPDHDWSGGSKGAGAAKYASFQVINNVIPHINEKDAFDYDFLHIGLIGIHEYEIFWNALETAYHKDENSNALNDVVAINEMIKSGVSFQPHEFTTWLDIGNIEGLKNARTHIPDRFELLDKIEEGIFLYDEFVVKFFQDNKTAKDRVARALSLDTLVPTIQDSTDNFYRYGYVDGELCSQLRNPDDFKSLLQWSKERLWIQQDKVDEKTFHDACYSFYYTKTKDRIEKFLNDNSIPDTSNVINGQTVPPISELLAMVDFDWLTKVEQYQFHGDFVLDNILKTKDGFCLLDWRQNFGGLLEVGDMYYDLGKLNHNLIISHDVIYRDLFTIDIKSEYITCDIMRKHALVQFQEVLYQFLEDERYDLRRVQQLTAIIWLNMAALHHYPFNIFLYFFGKYHLWKTLKQ